MKYYLNAFKEWMLYWLSEIAFFFKSVKNKIKGVPPHKYAGMYVIQPKFGGQYLKLTMQDGHKTFVFKKGPKGAEMFTRKMATTYISIYKKADKHRTRFAIVKKRVVTLFEEIEKEKIEQEQNQAAIDWAQKQSEEKKILPITTQKITPKHPRP